MLRSRISDYVITGTKRDKTENDSRAAKVSRARSICKRGRRKGEQFIPGDTQLVCNLNNSLSLQKTIEKKGKL